MAPSNALENSPLFEGVDPHAVATIARSLLPESWPRGRQIMGPAESVEGFHVLVEGRVKVYRSSPADGREVTLWLLGPGDGFDIVSLLDGKPHAVSVWTLENVRALAAPIEQWREWLERLRPLRLAAHRYIAERLREVTELAGDLALHDTPTRLAHLLLRHFEAEDHNLLRDLPQRELASMVGSVRIVVSRVLGQMRRQGIVELHGGAVRVADLKRLVRYAEAELAGKRTDARRSRKISKR